MSKASPYSCVCSANFPKNKNPIDSASSQSGFCFFEAFFWQIEQFIYDFLYRKSIDSFYSFCYTRKGCVKKYTKEKCLIEEGKVGMRREHHESEPVVLF